MKVTELKDYEMESINGGGITSSTINAITKAINTIYELGRQFGSSFRRLINGKYCPINWLKPI